MITNAAFRYLAEFGVAAHRATELCAGLPCLVHPELLFRAMQPEWSSSSHAHPLYHVGERHAGMRWALVALAPDHFSDLRDHLINSKPPPIALTIGGLPGLFYRCLTATYDQAYRPFSTAPQDAPAVWMRALALADLGCIELTDEARRAYENHRSFNTDMAGANGHGPPKSIKGALSPTRYLLQKGLPRDTHAPSPELRRAIALACALALRQIDVNAVPHLSKLVPAGYRLVPPHSDYDSLAVSG
jgi:hypothetical protein